MSEPFTVVYRGLTNEERSAIAADPKAVWFGWCHAPYERDAARAAVQAAQPEAVGLIRAMLHNAMDRMDRARNLLTDGKPRPDCNWGMLDASDLRKALASAPTTEATSSPSDADMFWNHDDTECFGHDINEIVQDFGPGEIVKIDQAKRLPTITVRVLPPKNENSDLLEYEVLDDAAIRATKGGKL